MDQDQTSGQNTTGRDSVMVTLIMAVDHAHLHDLVSRMETLLSQPVPDRQTVGTLLDELVCYARDHFEREDAMMIDPTQEEFVRHRQDHSYLLTCLTDFAEAFHRGTLAASVEVARDLERWLTFHVERFDSRLCALLCEREESPAATAEIQ